MIYVICKREEEEGDYHYDEPNTITQEPIAVAEDAYGAWQFCRKQVLALMKAKNLTGLQELELRVYRYAEFGEEAVGANYLDINTILQNMGEETNPIDD